METNINKLTLEEKIKNIEQWIEEIFQQNPILKKEILEYVLSYKETPQWVVNTTLLIHLLEWTEEIDEKNWEKKINKIYENETKISLLEKIHNKLNQIKKQFKKLLNELQNIDKDNLNDIEKLKIQILENWIDYYLTLIDIAYWGSFAEIEKLSFKGKNDKFKFPDKIDITTLPESTKIPKEIKLLPGKDTFYITKKQIEEKISLHIIKTY